MEKESNGLLAGAKGPTYLLFVGRDIKAFDVAKRLLEARIVKRLSTVYGYVNQLERDGLICLVKVEQGKPGPSKLRTASIKPVLETVRGHYELFEDRWLDGLGTLLENLDGVLDHFPKLLSERSSKKVENLTWPETLSIFFSFCKSVINECYWIKKHPLVSVENVHSSLETEYKAKRIDEKLYNLLRKSSIVMAPRGYIEDCQNQGKFTMENLARLADLSGDPQYDIYKDTFSGELFYMSVALKDPYLAYTLKRHVGNAIEYGKTMGEVTWKGCVRPQA